MFYRLCPVTCRELIDFQLEQKQIPPPYRPRLESERDLANFPPEFTDEPVQLTPDDQYILLYFDRFRIFLAVFLTCLLEITIHC